MMRPHQLQKARPSARTGQNELTDVLILAHAARGADDKDEHEIEIEEMNQAQVPQGGHRRVLSKSFRPRFSLIVSSGRFLA